MDRKKIESYAEKWKAIEDRIGGECGKRTVCALKELYSIYDDKMIECAIAAFVEVIPEDASDKY